MDEVYTPDVVLVFRPQADDGTVFMIQSFVLLVTLREVAGELEAAGISGSLIEIQSRGGGLVVSDTFGVGEPISRNGYHAGVLVD